MAKKYFEYAPRFIDTGNKMFSGISYIPNFLSYSSFFKDHIIAPEQEYRPDKIAFELWDNEDLSWVLDCINDFPHGIKEYTQGITIKYLPKNKLIDMGIL